MTTDRGTVDGPLPEGLRDRVLVASLAARASGRPAYPVDEIAPVEAFARSAGALDALLATLTPEQWRATVLRDLDAQRLVGHLTGVEEDVVAALDGSPLVADAEHVASTDAAARRQHGRSPEDTRAEWRRAVDRTLDRVRAGGLPLAATTVAIHGLRLTVDQLLVVRAFELWTHENDLRAAIDLPPSSPDPSVLALMTELAVRSLPRGVERAGLRPSGRPVRVVLTGPGGGTWDVALGSPEPDAVPAQRTRIVADAVDFCRLVAGRAARRAIDIDVAGDAAAADDVLTAAASLALD